MTEIDVLAPLSLHELYEELCSPFAIDLVELKPGATNQPKTETLAMPYADMRCYEDALDRIIGPDSWQSDYQLGDRGVVCRLRLLGIVKSGMGDYPANKADENSATSAEAQAFKRACSRFGLGRYLYRLSGLWVPYDSQRKRIHGDVRQIVTRMYRQAGLI